MIQARKRFKTKVLQDNYSAGFVLFQTRHRNYFNREGQPHRLNGFASSFWRGYFGEPSLGIPRATIAWAHYRAGVDCQKIFGTKFKYRGTELWKKEG